MVTGEVRFSQMKPVADEVQSRFAETLTLTLTLTLNPNPNPKP